MARYGTKTRVKVFWLHHALREHLIQYPQDPVAFHLLPCGEITQQRVAGQQHETGRLRQSQGKRVGQR